MGDLGGPALWQKVERTWVQHGAKEGRYGLGINPTNVGACTGVRVSEEEEEGASRWGWPHRALWSRGAQEATHIGRLRAETTEAKGQQRLKAHWPVLGEAAAGACDRRGPGQA